jgi:8-oxo-dGTP pyrophosphatase MutT (NUDIX family)
VPPTGHEPGGHGGTGSGVTWPALAAATAHDATARLPLVVAGRRVGSVARAHLPALAAWPQWLRIGGDAVAIDGDPAALTQQLAVVHAALRDSGLIVAWRDEPFPLFDPATLQPLATIERAACRFWGTLTLGAHCTGYVADATGRPTQLWIARRSATKATDPGKFDNLIGGGVPAGQTPHDALLREGWEEAGLPAATVRGARPGPVLRVQRDIREGLQHEWLYSFDLELPAGAVPRNQDGEVADFACLPADDAVALAAGDAMTVDAAVVTLDFARRHGLLPAAAAARVGAGLRALRNTRGAAADFKPTEASAQPD